MNNKAIVEPPRSRGVGEFARAHGISTVTTYRMIQRGDLIALKVGRRTIITAGDEARWLESLARAGGAK